MMHAHVRSFVCHPRQWMSENEVVPGAGLLDAMAARRFSPGTRTAVQCALQALKDADVGSPDAIFMGTGLGQLDDTIAFLDEMERITDGPLTPIRFMQSTHNTIGGVIARTIGAHGTNITFSQGMASFHWALQHALLQLATTAARHVMVGACDEAPETVHALARHAGLRDAGLIAAGCAFGMLERAGNGEGLARIGGCWPALLDGAQPWWESARIGSPIDLVLWSSDPFTGEAPELPPHALAIDHRPITGLHFSAPATAFDLALHALRGVWSPAGDPSPINRMLIVDLCDGTTSAILLER